MSSKGQTFEKKVNALAGAKDFDDMIKKIQAIFMDLNNKIDAIGAKITLLENGDDSYEQWREDATNEIRSNREEDNKAILSKQKGK